MTALDDLAPYFKPEDRKHGEDLCTQGVVVISSCSDANASAFIKSSPPCKVSFKATDIANPVFSADCTCTASRKGKLCKHIWAFILKLNEENADFLAERRNIEKLSHAKPQQSEFANRQAEYKKLQYERQKAYAKNIKLKKAAALAMPVYPPEITSALSYFKLNGIDLSHPFSFQDLNQAKKTLSQVFHPDKGGSHDEIIELNRNFDLLSDYLHTLA